MEALQTGKTLQTYGEECQSRKIAEEDLATPLRCSSVTIAVVEGIAPDHNLAESGIAFG